MRDVDEQSPAQEQAWEAYHRTAMDRAHAILKIRCADCESLFVGTQGAARDRGWRKKWRGKGGMKQQVDVCPFCRRPPRRPVADR